MSIETHFHPLRVVEVRRETDEAVSLRLELPAELAPEFRFQAGQYLTLRTRLEGEDLRRNYSVCASPFEGELRVAIKQIAGGKFSSWANGNLRAGDVIDVLPPQGRFTWRFDSSRQARYLAVAGGSGITPILSILKTALASEPESRFTLFYGNRATATIMFLEELSGLKNRYLDRLQIFHFLEDEEEEVELFNGRLDQERCESAIRALLPGLTLEAAFICGPGAMMEGAEKALSARGLAPDRILVERFTTSPPSAAQAAAAADLARRAAGATISVVLDGRKAQVAFDPARGSILDNVRAAGLSAPFACKGGVCATCRAKVLAGEVQMKVNYGLTQAEISQGYTLTCQAIPLSAGVLVSYDV
jgi:ring-1,2-phenylacetyl-CoA epoxidase subunit PaaE